MLGPKGLLNLGVLKLEGITVSPYCCSESVILKYFVFKILNFNNDLKFKSYLVLDSS